MYDPCLRTTVEIDDRHRAELLKLAAQRGEKGFSGIVREALDAYLEQQKARQELIDEALAQRGSFSQADADSLRSSIAELREKWRRRRRQFAEHLMPWVRLSAWPTS